LESVATQIERVRREQQLVSDYAMFIRAEYGVEISRLRVPLERTALLNDLYIPTRRHLIEAKGLATREAMRMAIGQITDYLQLAAAGGFDDLQAAVLIPQKPASSVHQLLRSQSIGVIWPDGAGSFIDDAGGEFT
jgi:hypothetical protein